MADKTTEYTTQYLENWNVDSSVNPPTMVRGMMIKPDSGSLSGTWQYWNGVATLTGDIQIGAVEIKDQGSDARVTVSASAMTVQTVVPGSVYSGRATGTAGTATVVGGNQLVKELTIKALWNNKSGVYVGLSTVTSNNGYELEPGDAISFPISNTNIPYIITRVNNEGITWLGVN